MPFYKLTKNTELIKIKRFNRSMDLHEKLIKKHTLSKGIFKNRDSMIKAEYHGQVINWQSMNAEIMPKSKRKILFNSIKKRHSN